MYVLTCLHVYVDTYVYTHNSFSFKYLSIYDKYAVYTMVCVHHVLYTACL